MKMERDREEEEEKCQLNDKEIQIHANIKIVYDSSILPSHSKR